MASTPARAHGRLRGQARRGGQGYGPRPFCGRCPPARRQLDGGCVCGSAARPPAPTGSGAGPVHARRRGNPDRRGRAGQPVRHRVSRPARAMRPELHGGGPYGALAGRPPLPGGGQDPASGPGGGCGGGGGVGLPACDIGSGRRPGPGRARTARLRRAARSHLGARVEPAVPAEHPPWGLGRSLGPFARDGLHAGQHTVAGTCLH